METWIGYALSDYLMFSPESYFRRFELANAELWPGQVLFLAAAFSLWWSILRSKPVSGLLVAPLLAAAWGFVAYGFLYRHYAQINLAADWFALVFVLQALLLLVLGLSKGYRRSLCEPRPAGHWHPGMLLFVYALLIHPLVGLAVGRPWQGIELFGVAPDATALATFGLLLAGYRAATWPLLVIPLAWCLIGALTYLAMGYVHGTAPLLLALMALAVTVVLHRQGRVEARPRQTS